MLLKEILTVIASNLSLQRLYSEYSDQLDDIESKQLTNQNKSTTTVATVKSTPTPVPITVKPTSIPIAVKPTPVPITVKPTSVPITVMPTPVPITVKPTPVPITVKSTPVPITVKPTSVPITVKSTPVPITVKSTPVSTVTTENCVTSEQITVKEPKKVNDDRPVLIDDTSKLTDHSTIEKEDVSNHKIYITKPKEVDTVAEIKDIEISEPQNSEPMIEELMEVEISAETSEPKETS
jgi:hypothetical protein